MSISLQTLKSKQVLCVGDVMLDRFVTGDVARISPEAPVPVLRQKTSEEMLGGAGNVVRNLSGLGVQVTLIGAWGQDDAGNQIQKLVEDMPCVQVSGVTSAHRPTTQKTRYVVQNQQLLRVDEEDTSPLNKAEEAEILALVCQNLPHVAGVILSDYAKGVLSHKLAQNIISAAQEANVPVLVDPQVSHGRAYVGATLLTPNLKEFNEMCQNLGIHGQDEEAHAQAMIEKLNLQALLVTKGSAGMTLYQQEKGPTSIPTEAKEVYDVSGAGDTVIAALMAGLCLGMSLEEASRLANRAGGIVVGRLGTATITAADLENQKAQTKLQTLDQILETVKIQRSKGKKVGFTNGCFDLLHPGHVTLLTQSRAECDFLILGLNTDASIKRLKGPTRPLQNQEARATVLAGLEAVDAIIFFGQDTPYELIKAIEPDILVKGSDYTVDQVVGADIVQARGGQVVLVDLVPGHSTTNLVTKAG